MSVKNNSRRHNRHFIMSLVLKDSIHLPLMCYLWENRVPCLCQSFINALIIPWDFPDSSVGKESACNAGNLGLILGWVRSPGEGKSYSLQCSGLENSMDYIVLGVAKSWTRLSDFHLSFHTLVQVTPFLCQPQV